MTKGEMPFWLGSVNRRETAGFEEVPAIEVPAIVPRAGSGSQWLWHQVLISQRFSLS